MKRIRLTILAILLCCAVSNAAQPHHFYARFTSWEGLPEAYISSVCQDGFDRIWIGSKDGVFYYNGEEFVPFTNQDYLDNCSLNTPAVKLDADGCIWIVSQRGTGYYDIYSDRFTVIEELGDIYVSDIDITPDGAVWLTSSSGVWKYDKPSGELTNMTESTSFSPFRACVTSDGNLAFTARNNSIYVLNATTGNVKSVRTDLSGADFQFIEYIGDSKLLVSDGLHEVCVADLGSGVTESLIDDKVILNKAEVQCLLYEDGLYWIGTTYGLLIYDPLTRTLEKQFPDELNIATLGGESVRCLFSDKYGNVWAGTWNGGLRCWMTYEAGFSRFVSDETPHTMAGNTVRAVCDGPDGRIWIGSEEGYLCRFDPKDQSFADFTPYAGVAFGTAITDLTRIGSLIWITSYGDGITAFDPVAGKAVRKYHLPNNDCMAIMKASDGFIYAGTREGMYRFNQSSDAFELVDIVGKPFVHSIVEDKGERLVISTFYQGFGIYDIPSGSYRKAQAAQGEALTSFMLDSRGELWATTDGAGICKISISADGNTVDVKHFDKSSGLPSNTAGSITEDEDGHFWIATSMGLVDFDPKGEKVLGIYMQADNVIGRHFTFGSNYKSPDGLVFLGTNEGLLMFEPEYIQERFGHSPIRITDITLGSSRGTSLASQKGRSAITSESIRVKQKDATFISLTYSAMNYSSPNIERYECQLVKRGFRNQIVTDENHITYTGLRPGSYRFTVNFADSEDDSTEASLDIAISAPWYRSTVAWLLYLLLLGGMVLTYFIQKNKKNAAEAQRRLELVEAKKEKDLAHEKMDFFTNIAHEIRTPVSVLQILLDKTVAERKVNESVKEDMNAMRLNVERLKKLCDDLLDFRKMDSGRTHLVFATEDICAIVRKSINSFETAAKARGLDMTSSFSSDAIMTVCDADAIESVVCNLLSNSIKYSKSRIDVSVKEEDEKVIIRVENDGVRVPEEESELIFEAFYQSKSLEKNGTGLGLTYSRKIASLHQGRLFLDTAVKDLNSFVLEIPEKGVQESRSETPAAKSSSQIEDDLPELPGQKPVVLVVEDNDTMRNLIRAALVKDYDILSAGDGEEALSIVRDSRVDLVVSDIMMPRMDGCELCNAIKEDISLSHIPVLLLTAAVGVETHIRSLKSGADAYIEKPFKMDVLKANISNLFRNRDIRNEQFSSSPLSHYSFSSVSKIEEDFMNSLHSYIQDHISETELTIDKLADAMAVSRATLTRKVKANTGLTVNEYVRISRLKKAVELLAENNYRINEVAYLVGYSSPSYFTLSFQKQFGKLPSEFIKKKTQ
jgi:signal transduction histidine kinase/DNA-binding response OmpR family regulator/streptogramin lyase